MKFPLLFGIIGGIIAGYLQYLSITKGEGSGGAILYYSPLILYIASIYMAIKKTMDADPASFAFKVGLKAGGLTATIMSVIWGIGFFIALTHTDVNGLIKYLIDTGQRDQVKIILAQVNKQAMFDRTKFFTIPYFLLGFFVTVAVTLIFSKRKSQN